MKENNITQQHLEDFMGATAEMTLKYLAEQQKNKELEDEVRALKKRIAGAWEITAFVGDGRTYRLTDWQKLPCYSGPNFESPGHQIGEDYGLKNYCLLSMRRLSDSREILLNNEQGVQVSDTTGDQQRTERR